MEEDGAHTLTMLGIKFTSHLPAHIKLGMVQDYHYKEGKRRVQMAREVIRFKASDREKWEATAAAADGVAGRHLHYPSTAAHANTSPSAPAAIPAAHPTTSCHSHCSPTVSRLWAGGPSEEGVSLYEG